MAQHMPTGIGREGAHGGLMEFFETQHSALER